MNPKDAADLEARHRRYDEELFYERYHRGQLSEAEREEFEEFFLTSDHCLDRLEAVERLEGAMRDVAVEESIRFEQQAQVVQAVAAVVWWRRWTFWRQAGSALLLVLMSVGLWRLDAERDTLRRQLERASSPPSRTFLVPLDAVRSGGDDAVRRLDLTQDPEWIVLTLQAPRSTELYVVGLQAADGRDIWRQSDVEADASGQLLVGLPSGLLQDGRYTVWMKIQGDSEEQQTYPLVVERVEIP